MTDFEGMVYDYFPRAVALVVVLCPRLSQRLIRSVQRKSRQFMSDLNVGSLGVGDVISFMGEWNTRLSLGLAAVTMFFAILLRRSEVPYSVAFLIVAVGTCVYAGIKLTRALPLKAPASGRKREYADLVLALVIVAEAAVTFLSS